MAVGNTLGRTQASRHIQACRTTSWVMASRHRFGRVRRPVHRDARVAIGAWRSALMDACSASNLQPLGWTILRYVTHSNGCAPSVMQSQLIGGKMLDGRSFRRNTVAITRRTEAGVTQCWRKIRSVAPLCPACCAVRAAGHHGCARTCQAPICRAGSRHTAANGIA